MLLTKEGASTLVQVITQLSQRARLRVVPPPYRELFYELSLNTPICGILQVAGSKEAIHVIKLLAQGVDIQQSCYQQQLKLLQDRAPLLASFILKLPFEDGIPDDVCALISDSCDLAVAPYQVVAPTFQDLTANIPFFQTYPRFVVHIATQLTNSPPVEVKSRG